jgi:hypothetical protein
MWHTSTFTNFLQDNIMFKLRAGYASNNAAVKTVCNITGNVFKACIGMMAVRADLTPNLTPIDPEFIMKYAHNVANIQDENGYTFSAGDDEVVDVTEILVPVDAPELEHLYVVMALDVLDGYRANVFITDPNAPRNDPRKIVEDVLVNHSFDFKPDYYQDEPRMCGLAKASAAFRMLQLSLPVIKAVASGNVTSDPDLAAALAVFDVWGVKSHDLVNEARSLFSAEAKQESIFAKPEEQDSKPLMDAVETVPECAF